MGIDRIAVCTKQCSSLIENGLLKRPSMENETGQECLCPTFRGVMVMMMLNFLGQFFQMECNKHPKDGRDTSQSTFT